MKLSDLDALRVDVADAQHWPGARKCGLCRLCCVLLAVDEIGKPDNTPCKHLCRKGCSIYKTKPDSCTAWSCRWRLGDVPTNIDRPDRSHVILDVKQEELIDDETIVRAEVIWCDPDHRDAWLEQPVLEYIMLLANFNIATVVRYNRGEDYIAVYAPNLPQNGERKWITKPGKLSSIEEHEANLAALRGKSATPTEQSTPTMQKQDDAPATVA